MQLRRILKRVEPYIRKNGGLFARELDQLVLGGDEARMAEIAAIFQFQIEA